MSCDVADEQCLEGPQQGISSVARRQVRHRFGRIWDREEVCKQGDALAGVESDPGDAALECLDLTLRRRRPIDARQLLEKARDRVQRGDRLMR